MVSRNPFEFDAAPNLDPEQLISWYIEDHNYSRFFESSRNIIMNGERGSGKSMTLIYHSLKYKHKRFDKDRSQLEYPSKYAGVYIPCNTPLSAKEEYRLLDEMQSIQLSETNLTYSVLTNVAQEFSIISPNIIKSEKSQLVEEFAFYLDADSPATTDICPFLFLRREIHRRIRRLQRDILENRSTTDISVNNFSTMILPILTAIRSLSYMNNAHISLLIDDMQFLNPFQQRVVNSWIGYRDHSIFSIKASVAGLRGYDFSTSFRGVLLEGHDYITVDLQRPIQNSQSEYGKFAREVVRRRLREVGVDEKPENYFPVHPKFDKALEVSLRKAQDSATARGYVRGSKQFNDYVYKMRRAFYYRDRDSKANKPLYSGFDTLAHLSTGVIRNLLQPLYFMYEMQSASVSGKVPEKIPSDVQNNVVIDQSDKLWDFITENLERRIDTCTDEDATRVANLFKRLAEYFRTRLLYHDSEPRVVTFIVSERDNPAWGSLQRLLEISERAQILYVRDGTSKKGGGRETYYVPNRLLWPRYGLDAHGQHGRASLRARDLWAAADSNKALELEGTVSDIPQGSLFGDE